MGSTPEVLRDLQFWFRQRRASRGAKVSNFDEQAIIDRFVKDLNIVSRTAVDIGAGDGIRSSNTFHLFAQGWQGLGIEADPVKARRLSNAYSSLSGVRAVKAAVQPDTVGELLRSNGIEQKFGVLSLDIDGNDYWVLDAILSEFRPQLIVSEYNEKIPPPIKFVVNYDPQFTLRHHFYGYSIEKLEDLLAKHSYVLLEVEYNNVFLAPRELGAEGTSAAEAYKKGYADRKDRQMKFAGNANLEPLLGMSPEEGVAFLDEFYKPFAGEYTIETGT